jgi:hypothetical protein
MDGTEVLNGADGELISGPEVPMSVANLCIDGIRTFHVYDDDDGPILVISDGVTTVEFACGLSRRPEPAASGARRLAEAAREFAVVLEAAPGRCGPTP